MKLQIHKKCSKPGQDKMNCNFYSYICEWGTTLFVARDEMGRQSKWGTTLFVARDEMGRQSKWGTTLFVARDEMGRQSKWTKNCSISIYETIVN